MLSAMEQVAELTPRREPIRVVVVDDQELFRRGLIMLVAAEEDIEVVGEASDGDEAAELAASTVPDVVLMDVRMPKRSGIEACRTIKQVAPSAKIIMLTVSDEEGDLYDAIKNGASGYLLKDASIDQVEHLELAVGELGHDHVGLGPDRGDGLELLEQLGRHRGADQRLPVGDDADGLRDLVDRGVLEQIA